MELQCMLYVGREVDAVGDVPSPSAVVSTIDLLCRHERRSPAAGRPCLSVAAYTRFFLQFHRE